MFAVHRRFIGKLLVDFLLVIIEHLSTHLTVLEASSCCRYLSACLSIKCVHCDKTK